MGSAGSWAAGLNAAIRGSFQVLTSPRKTAATVSASSTRPLSTPGRWYASTTAPSVIGRGRTLPGAPPPPPPLFARAAAARGPAVVVTAEQGDRDHERGEGPHGCSI